MSPSSKDLAVHVSIGVVSTFLISWLDIRPLGVLFLAGLLVWTYTMFCPCSFTLENAKPIQDKVRGNLETFAKLRREKPAVFCLIVSVALFLLMILGHIISGTWLVIGGLSVVGLISSRHSVRIVRAPPKAAANDSPALWSAPILTTVRDEHSNTQTTSNDNASADATLGAGCEIDEFLPEVNESALQVLNLAGDDAILFSAKTRRVGGLEDDADSDSDSVPLMMLMPDEMVTDVERDQDLSDDSLSEEVALIAKHQEKRTNQHHHQPPQTSSNALISSDEDEDSLSKGLNFDEYNVVDAGQPRSHLHKKSRSSGAVPKELTGLMTDFVSNMIPWNKVGTLMSTVGGGDNKMSQSESAAVGGGKRTTTMTTGRRDKMQRSGGEGAAGGGSMESSDDSEFEILNKDELKSYET